MFILNNQTAVINGQEVQTHLAAHNSEKCDGNIGTVYDKEKDCIHVVVYDSDSDTWKQDKR
jgi:ribosomal protein L21E